MSPTPDVYAVPRRANGKREHAETLRVAFLAGELGKGGAEKQLVYMCRALVRAGVEVRVFVLAPGGHFDGELRGEGLAPHHPTFSSNPLVRLLALRRALKVFRPHVLHASHFYTNIYVAILSRMLGMPALGTIRNDTIHELNENGIWGPIHLKLPRSLVANSHAARENAMAKGIRGDRIAVLHNVIDLESFDRERSGVSRTAVERSAATAAVVCRLVPAKRVDRFLEALALARAEEPSLGAVIAGDGPERAALERRAGELGLDRSAVRFLGMRDDVPSILREADFLVLSSDHEGFPNVLLEAMAARRAVVTTSAGDSGRVVEDGTTGIVLQGDGVKSLAAAMVGLARNREERIRMGEAGRRVVERDFDSSTLAARLLSLYEAVASRQGRDDVRQAARSAAATAPPGGVGIS